VSEGLLRPKRSWQRRLRPLILSGVVLLIVGKIVFLSPSLLEESQSPPKTLEMSTLVDPDQHPRASGIPTDKTPDYTIQQFTYLSTHNDEKEWNLNASEAYLFNALKLVHSKQVKALLYDTDGNTTVVTGDESKYLMNQRDLEVFGNVVTTLPDGFVIKSDYMRYRPQQKHVEIPASYAVAGDGQEQGGEHIHFTSQGLEFDMEKSEIYLPSSVHFTTVRSGPQEEPTTILSDRCMIYRKKQIAHFTMNPSRSNSSRFVEIEQPSTWGKGRRADLNYGTAPELVQYMTLFEDVSIKDLKKDPGAAVSAMKYATGGRADFDSHQNVIVLTEYPQVYQDEDTVTGDKILLHRDTDIIEVEHSNAFRQGN
jgi:LPS export ABC transporter protein LptC